MHGKNGPIEEHRKQLKSKYTKFRFSDQNEQKILLCPNFLFIQSCCLDKRMFET